MSDREIIMKRVSDLVPYVNNPRDNDKAVEPVKNSIKEFGFKVPMVIDKDNVVVCGHTRLRAAKELGLNEVPCIMADDLTDEQIKAFRLADNKTAELAGWNFDMLPEEMKGVGEIDMTAFGFDQTEVEDPNNVREDEYEEEEMEPVAQAGMIFELGEHRVMCGDSTSKDDLKKLLGGGSAEVSLY